ncbi:MAG: hypothetical protein V1932_05390 [Chloroflexota bacterium]
MDAPEYLQQYPQFGPTLIPLKHRSKVPLVKCGNGWNPTCAESEAWVSRPSVLSGY